MEKYYTPDLEEFHVGFEYEIFEDFDCLPEKEWHDQVYGKNGSNHENMDYVGGDMNKFRVKHLDREDIESFKLVYAGWKRVSHDYYGKIKNRDVSVHVFKDNTVTVSVRLDGMIESECTNIIIKNKSELKRILKQVGV